MPTVYATLADIPLYGLPVSAVSKLTPLQQQACLDAASAEMDSYFRARYTLPFTSYGVELTEKCVIIAKFKMLSLRGFNPQPGSDKDAVDAYAAAKQWLIEVKTQLIHPDVSDSATLDPQKPFVASATPRGY